MSESTASIVYFINFALAFILAVYKCLALRRDPNPTLALTAAVFVTSAPVYILASPAGYRAVGQALNEPSFASLPVYLGILAVFAYTHMFTFLVDQELRENRAALRRRITAWTLTYSVAGILMVVFFYAADLAAPPDPLMFNTSFAHDPWVVACLAVFLVTLTLGTLNTYWRCRRLTPEDPGVQHSLRAFALAMWFVFGYALCQAPAIAFAAAGNHSLDQLGLYGAVPGCIGFQIMCYGMSGSAIGAWLRERRDTKALQPLWDLVVGGVDEELAFSARSARSRRVTANVTFNLHRRVIEILDGTRALRPWVTRDATEIVYALREDRDSELSPLVRRLSDAELEAAATAVALRDAAERLQTARDTWVRLGRTGRPQPQGVSAVLPGEDTPAGEERERLLLVAKALSQPIVQAALLNLREERVATAVSP
ncbi:MAB_1171c family putative transporter [Streptomyces sp. NPDC127084]|uniref:MAB_1171c family putative transporter n=1 Tax=Streptomyces sp. NPDC127084 TaxID=3347133 RepID=UPI003656540A